MGMGNLETVLAAFGGGRRSYAELYFDSTPFAHERAYRRLASFGDDSSNYFWKLGAAQRDHAARAAPTRPRLARTAALQTADDSARRLLLTGAPRGRSADTARGPRGHRADAPRPASSCDPRRSPWRSTPGLRCARSPARRRCA